MLRLAALLSLVALAACGDEPTRPARPRPTQSLTICAGTWWLAYRNEGGVWTRPVPAADGTVTFAATERLTIARARVSAQSPSLNVEQVTVAQARANDWCSRPTTGSFGSAQGVMQGLEPGGWAQASYGGPGPNVHSSETTFVLPRWREVGDLVATRFAPYDPPRSDGDRVDALIVRRAQAYAAGTRVVLDFDASEAFAPAEHALRWTGPTAHVQHNFYTAEGADHVLQSRGVPPDALGDVPRSMPLYSMPASRLATGDVHRVMVSGGQREVILFYHAPRERTLAFGPSLAPPTFATVATTPYGRVRVTLPSQAEYGAYAYVNLRQQAGPGMGSLTLISLTASREHFGGTPREWSLTVPDLSGLPGFADYLGLKPGAFEWGALATSGGDVNAPPPLVGDTLLVRRAHAYGTHP